MLKAKIAAVLIVGSLLLGGCASKSPVNIDNAAGKANNAITQEIKDQGSNDINNVPQDQNVASNTANPASSGQAANQGAPVNNGNSDKASEQKAVVQAQPKAANNQGSNNTQSASYNKSNTAPAQSAPAVVSQNGVEYLAAVEDEVLRLCNIERSKAGLSPLVMDSKVREAARFKAQEMLTRNYFDHNSPYSGSPFDLMKSRGISFGYAGENIQMSEGKDKAIVTAQYLVTNWMNSPGHRANILKPEFKKMGIGVAFSSNGNKAYESQLFTD